MVRQWPDLDLDRPRFASHREVADLVARIGRSDAAREMLAEMRKRIASYERMPADVSEPEVLETCKRGLRLWYQWLASGGSLAADELSALRASVRTRAEEGVPLEDLLHAYRIGGRLGWQILRRHATAEEQEALLDGAELLMLYIDTLSEIVTETYLGEHEPAVAEDERRARGLLERIVDGTPLASEERHVAACLAIRLGDAYVPFAVAISGASPRRYAALAARLRERGRLAVTEGSRVFGLASGAVERGELDEGQNVLLAAAEETPRASLEEMRENLRLLVDHGRRTGLTGTLTPESHALELLLARSPRVADTLCARVLGPLTRGGEGADLLRTLRTLLGCGLDRARTSALLHVHRNTLGYRIGRIERLTGLDLAQPRDLACAYLAINAEAASRPPSAPERVRGDGQERRN